MNLIDKVHQQVESFKGQEFIAPYLGSNSTIKVSINGLILNLKPNIRARQLGHQRLLGLWQTHDGKIATFDGKIVSGKSIREYITLFPKVRLLITRVQGPRAWGVMSRTGTGKIQVTGEVPIVNLYDWSIPFELFDEVLTHCDGHTFFYREYSVNDASEMMVAAKLREEVNKRRFTYNNEAALVAKFMRPEHATAFQTAWDHLMKDAKGMVETIIGNAVSHAGGKLEGYKEDDDTYRIDIKIDDIKQRQVVVSKNLEVISAGICLSGQDQIFDLQSLVSVLQENKRDYDNYDH